MASVFGKIFNLGQTSYWLPVIWWLVAGLLFGMMPKQEVVICGRRQRQWYWFCVVIMVLPFILWTGYRGSVGDTASYVRHFDESAAVLSEIPEIIRTTGDWGFYTMIVLLKGLGVESSQTFFLILAGFQIWCLTYIFRRYSGNFWISFFMFLASTDYISWMQNGIRQFTAVCITFAAFELLVRRSYLWFTLVTLIASTFHGTALLMLPFACVMEGSALNRRCFLVVGAAALAIPMVDVLMPVFEKLLSETRYSDVMTSEIWLHDDGTNLIRVLVYSVPALISLLGFRHVRSSRDRAANLCINAATITMAVYLLSSVTSGIFVGRIPIYTTLHGYVVLPWMIDRIFEKQTAGLIKVMLVGFYLAFFAYQMNQWGLL